MTTAIEHAAQMGVSRRARPTYGYYRQANGWVKPAVTTQLEELKYRQEGWEPLPQYGRFEMATEYTADNPLEGLFMFGGAKELLLDQIVEMGLHLNPPLIPTCRQHLTQSHKRHMDYCWTNAQPVYFPQLEGLSWEDYQCRFCDRAPFPTDKARNQHESVMHKDEKSDIRTGESLAQALTKGLRSAPTESSIDPDKPYICGLCGDGFKAPIQLTRHVKAHKGEQDDEG